VVLTLVTIRSVDGKMIIVEVGNETGRRLFISKKRERREREKEERQTAELDGSHFSLF
jgi:hypothetical protein